MVGHVRLVILATIDGPYELIQEQTSKGQSFLGSAWSCQGGEGQN